MDKLKLTGQKPEFLGSLPLAFALPAETLQNKKTSEIP
jgi:hypothetical protein